MEQRVLHNIIYSEIEIGQSASVVKQLTKNDIAMFGLMSGDINPAHFNQEYAQTTMFKDVIAHGMWSGGQISTVMGTQLPGPGTIYISQSLKFSRPVYVGDEITTQVTILEKKDKNRVILECKCTNQKNEVVTSGIAEVIAPTEKLVLDAPRISLDPMTNN